MAESDRTASLMSPRKLAQMKPAAPPTPAVWLDRMAADAGHQHVARMSELAPVIGQQCAGLDLGPVASQLKRLDNVLPELDFALLERLGWWDRTRGKGRSRGAEFGAQFERIDEAARSLDALVQSLGNMPRAESVLPERALVELEVEAAAIEKIIDQGTRWLHDMRNQLKLRQAGAADVQAQQAVLEDSQRCDILVARLKHLRGLCDAAAQALEQTRALARGRRVLAQALQQNLAAQVEAWRDRVGPQAAAAGAGAGAGPALGHEGPARAHEELVIGVRKALADCEQVQARHQTLARCLALLTAGNLAPG